MKDEIEREMTQDIEDRKAILAVIEAETDAYMGRDYDAWRSHWLDSPHIRRLHSHSGTGAVTIEGIEVLTLMKGIMEEYPDPIPKGSVRRENINLVVSPAMAWCSYDQIGENTGEEGGMNGVMHELKILQKVDNTWKLVCLVMVQRRIDHVEAPLIEVDQEARVLWMNDAARDRLPNHPGLELSGAYLKPRGPEARIHLAAALEWLREIRERHTPMLGHDHKARAVSLGQDDYSMTHICWAVLRDSKLLITFDDSEMLERQLASASRVYGLSEAQSAVIRRVVDGKDLATAAVELGISINTARTHLHRVYDKIGVRSQPALVRLLLSADIGGV